MGILIRTPFNELPRNEDGLEAFVSALPGFQGQPTDSYSPVEAIRNTDIFTAVRMIAGDLARMDIQIIQNGVRQQGHLHDRLFNVRPNDIQNGYVFKFILYANTLLTGHGYVEIFRDNSGTPTQFVFRPTSAVKRKTDDKDGIYYEIETSKATKKVNYYDLIDLKFHTIDGFNGLSLIDILSNTMATDEYGKSFLSNFLRNGTHAGGILTMKGVLNNKEARERAKESFERSFSGSKKAGSVLVLDESMSYKQLEVDTSIIKLIQDNKASTKEIAGVFGIPLHKFGIETSNMSIVDANLDYLSTLAPYIKSICSTFDFYLNNDDSGLIRHKIDTSEMRVIDEETQATIDNMYLNNGSKTIDEIRAAKGLPPVEGGYGSKHRVDLNHVNIEKVDDYQMNKATDNKHLISEGGEES